MNSNLRIVIAGGGTGGHFFPALTIKQELIKKNIQVFYIGSSFGIENKYFTTGDNALLLNIRGIQRQKNIQSLLTNFLFPFRFVSSYLKTWKLISNGGSITVILGAPNSTKVKFRSEDKLNWQILF